MKHIITLIIITFCCLSSAITQIVQLSGTNPTYAHHEITFYTNEDYITGKEKIISTTKADSNGYFKVEWECRDALYIYTYLGIYKGHMFVEPGKKYTLAFPDRTDKSSAEELNPFFEPTEFMIGLPNSDTNDVNFLIKTFDNSYFPYFNKLALNIRSKTNPSELDRAIKELRDPWQNNPNVFLKQYIEYRIGMLQLLAYQYKTKAVSSVYFSGKPILYQNIAYMELFNKVFDKYFLYYGSTATGKIIYQNINSDKSFEKLKQSLQLDDILKDDTLLELVMLKNIHENFYSDKFSRVALLNILDTLISKSQIEQHKAIGKTIRNKVTMLLPGYTPPDFMLFNKNDSLISLSNFIGKPIYLNFCSCNSYSCFKEFELLNKLQEKYGDKIHILTIICDGTPEGMKLFLSKNNYNWQFVHYQNQKSIRATYRAMAYPAYFFIGKDGKMIYSPCLSPAEGFETKLQEYLLKK